MREKVLALIGHRGENLIDVFEMEAQELKERRIELKKYETLFALAPTAYSMFDTIIKHVYGMGKVFRTYNAQHTAR